MAEFRAAAFRDDASVIFLFLFIYHPECRYYIIFARYQSTPMSMNSQPAFMWMAVIQSISQLSR